MKTLISTLLTLTVIAISVVFSAMYFRNTGITEGLLLQAVEFVFKWYIIGFNALVGLLTIPLFFGKRNAVALYNNFAGSFIWAAIEGMCWTYLLIWFTWMIPSLDVLTGLHWFHTYEFGKITYHFPVLGTFVLTSRQWELMFILGFLGILGAKGSFLFSQWAGTLRDEELVVDAYGRIWTK